MIIVKIIGGLGNQLFQYAVGRHLAEIHKTELKIDILGFKAYKLHKYSLWPFNIQEKFASAEEVAVFGVRRRGIAERAIRRVLRRPPKFPPTYIREKQGSQFDPDVLNLSDVVYLYGSWQSEKYFKNIEEIIRKEFTVKFPLEGKNLELAEQIESCEAVSLHIRRGDYISDPKTNEVHGVCGLDYYLCCVEKLTATVGNPHFFVFSDEPEWARDNLGLHYPTTIVAHNGADKNYEDMRLMSQCKHHIIANSSFSWWGAWLNPRPGKLVYAPQQWFAHDKWGFQDIVPTEWLRR